MCLKAKKCQNMLADRLFFVMHFVSLRVPFNLRPNLEVKEYCEGQNLGRQML